MESTEKQNNNYNKTSAEASLDQRQMEEKLMHDQKLEAIGRLSGGNRP